MLNKKSLNIRLFAIVLISTLVTTIIINQFSNQVDAAVDKWIEPVDNEYQSNYRITDAAIVQEGKHNPARDGVVRYRTIGYQLSSKPFDLDMSFSSGSNATIEKTFLNGRVGGDYIDGDGMKVTSYTIKMEDFVKAAAEIGIDGEYIIEHNGASVYLQNIFESFLNDTTLKGPLKDKQEFLGAHAWSDTTREVIDSYYNYEFKLLNVVYNLEVVAVDADGNLLNDPINLSDKHIGNPVYTKNVIYGELFNYLLSNDNKELISENVNYKYSNKWYYSYTNRKNNTYIKVDTRETEVTMETPDAKIGSTLTIYLVFDKKSEPYKYKAVAYDDKGNYLRDLNAYTFDTSFGNKETYRPNTPITVKGKDYTYQNKWSLVYEDRLSGSIKTISRDNEERVYQFSMPDARYGSTAEFRFVYKTGPAPSPTPTPPVGPAPTMPPVPEVTPPPPATEKLEFTDVVTTGIIRADVRGSERFIATVGVPTTESLFGEVTARDYLLGFKLEKKVGIKYYVVEVSKDYILNWESATPDTAGGGKPKTETVTITQHFTVPRAYGYWEIMNLESYKIDHAVLNNYALPGGSITLHPNYSHYNPPAINYSHSSNEADHIIPPTEVAAGIKLPSQTISASGTDKTSRPIIPEESATFEYAALTQTGQIKVKSDYLSFRGNTVMSDAVSVIEAPYVNTSAIPQCNTFINKNVLYKPDQIIEATKKNGTYGSNGTIIYSSIALVNPTRPASQEYIVNGINDVVIHTPVVCKPSIAADNDKYVQLLKPTQGAVQLVLDPDQNLSDFTVTISNTGLHSNKLGYYTRDFSKSLRDPAVSYIASSNGILRNEVQFPFDVYLDIGKDNDQSNDKYVKSGTWVVIGRSSPRFYLPMWTIEGIHTINFRTVAVNGEPYINKTERYANTDLRNYVATNTLDVEVSGRIYGLTIYDMSDYPMWEEAFRVPKSKDFKKNDPRYPDGTGRSTYNKNYSYTYTIGTNDQYGNDTGRNNKYTLPLVNGSHPYYKNQGILKTGYMFRYSLETTGNMFSDANMVMIKPNFYFVDKDGKNRKAVDLYYTEEIYKKNRHLVKVGSSMDQINMKSTTTGDLYLGIPEWEMKQTAAIRKTSYLKFTANREAMYNFSDIRLHAAFRTYVNEGYTAMVKTLDSFEEVLSKKVKENDITSCKQRWYGEYYLPNEVHAVEKGFDVYDYMDKYGVDYSEDFWLTEGYIIVNFSIETLDQYGNRRLSYTNASNYRDNGHCSMWVMEGPVPNKKDYYGIDFTFYAGDVMVYYADKRMTDDYSPGVIY